MKGFRVLGSGFWVACALLFALVGGMRAEVPPFLDYQFVWQPRPATEAIETYWIWRRIPPSPLRTVALVTTNRGSVWVSNVNTLIAYEWSIGASNRLGISDPSDISPTPANPRPVKDGRVAAIRMRVPARSVIEQGPDLNRWSERFFLMPVGGNALLFTYQLRADEPMQFWRWRPLTNALISAPKPQ